MDFRNKVVLITGASKGIGKEIALQFAQNGAKVALNASRMSDYFKDTLNTFDKNGYDYVDVIGDVSSPEDVKNMIKKVEDTFGNVDIVVNNAGITQDTLLMRMSEEQWDKVLDVNLKGAYNVVKNVIRPMIKKRWGRIINISSVVGLIGNLGQANYAASKAGLIGFSKSVAKEFGKKGVTCNAIAPGFIESDMTAKLNEDIAKKYLDNIPLNRFGSAKDVANLVMFIASDEASYITGQVLNVDGGMVM